MSLSKPLTEAELILENSTNFMLDGFVRKHPTAQVIRVFPGIWTVKMPKYYEVLLEVKDEDTIKFTLVLGMISQMSDPSPPKPDEGCVARCTTQVKKGVWNVKLYVKGQPFADGIEYETEPGALNWANHEFILTPLEVREVLDDIYVWIYHLFARNPTVPLTIDH